MDECVKNNYANKLRVFIPSDIDHYISDYHKNWCQSPITEKDISNLENVLREIQEKNPSAMLEMKHDGGDITQEDFNFRHDYEARLFSDEVYAFQVNNSTGTQDTIDKAKVSGLIISLHKKYSI